MDARSCIPDIETKKYCVDSSMRFGDFVDFIRKQIKHRGSLFVYVNDREPETDFLMYQVYANNIDKYGFLRMTYSGECRVCGLGNMCPRTVDNVAARSDIIPDMILMASGILGSTSKGKAKILISSSSFKSDGGGGGNGVTPGGGGGNGVTPGGGDGVPTGGGGGDVGGRERMMVDIVRRVRRTGQIEEEELLMSINIMSTSFGHFEGILRDFIRVLNMSEDTWREY
ncbi:hypothetical protein ACFX2I_030702 [Malus domestica]